MKFLTDIMEAVKAVTTTAFKCPAERQCATVDDCDGSCKKTQETKTKDQPQLLIFPSKGNFDH